MTGTAPYDRIRYETSHRYATKIRRYNVKKAKFGIMETGTSFITGIVFSPSWDDVNAIIAKMFVLGLIKDLVPDVKVSVILAHRGAMRMTVPLILERADIKKYREKAPFEVQAMLWVLACFWYKWGGGPHPAPALKRRYPRRGAVLEFRCPMCGKDIWEPNPRFKKRSVIIKQFATVLNRHAIECDKVLHLDWRVK